MKIIDTLFKGLAQFTASNTANEERMIDYMNKYGRFISFLSIFIYALTINARGAVLKNNCNVPSYKNADYTDCKAGSSLSTKEYNWYPKYVKGGVTPLAPPETSGFLPKYNCCFLGDTSRKFIYLTFDEGYENGYTASILDILKKHNAKAAFFVVKPYIKSNPDLIKRMESEGHLVCNHSANHPSMASIVDEARFNKELSDVEEAYKSVTGKDMPKYFRPPMGKYSELSLYYTQKYGYKTVFWSFAYADWDPKKQMPPESAKKKILDRTHNGAIVLLHAVSKTNTEILDDVLAEWERQGYEIKSLDSLS